MDTEANVPPMPPAPRARTVTIVSVGTAGATLIESMPRADFQGARFVAVNTAIQVRDFNRRLKADEVAKKMQVPVGQADAAAETPCAPVLRPAPEAEAGPAPLPNPGLPEPPTQ